MFRIKFDFHPRNLSQMIHPYQGYLGAFPTLEMTFEELLRVYRIQLVSSYERCQGQEIFANEISCYSFWDLLDKKKTGVMNLEQFRELLVVSDDF